MALLVDGLHPEDLGDQRDQGVARPELKDQVVLGLGGQGGDEVDAAGTDVADGGGGPDAGGVHHDIHADVKVDLDVLPALLLSQALQYLTAVGEEPFVPSGQRGGEHAPAGHHTQDGV